MAYSTQRAVSDGTLVLLNLSLDYFDRSEIAVLIGGIVSPAGSGKWAWVGTTNKQISFTPAIANGVEVRIKRSTQLAAPLNQYTKGAQFVAETLDDNFNQVLRIAQEAAEGSGAADVFNDVDYHGFRIRNVGPAVDPSDVVTLAQYQSDSLGAGTARTQAAASASAAATSATNAATSATNAATSEGNALTYKGQANTSAGNAAQSATNAATSEGNALTYKNSAASTLTAFKNQYHGAFATAPTLRPDATAIQVGDLYFDTALAALRVYQSGSWTSIPTALTGSASQDFTAKNLQATSLNGGAFGGFRNKLHNGSFVVDQRNNGAVSNVQGYGLDRWTTTSAGTGRFSTQQVTDAPAGFPHSLKTVVTTAATPATSDAYQLFQPIEGYNVADLQYGTAGAKQVAVSFYVKASIAGTYSVFLYATTTGGTFRTNVTTYTVNAANTWEYKTLVFSGDTASALLAGNAAALLMGFDLGAGSTYVTANTALWQAGTFRRTSGSVNWISTLGATFQISGVQLERGNTATIFEQRPYSTEKELCMRYFEAVQSLDQYMNLGAACTQANYAVPYMVQKRAPATISSNGGVQVWNQAAQLVTPTALSYVSTSVNGFSVNTTNTSGLNGLPSTLFYASADL